MEVSGKKPVALEVATADITRWLDKKKVYEATREASKESIDILIEAMMNGDLILEEKDFVLTHKLLFPLEEVVELKYKSRLNDNMIRPHLQGVKATDGEGRFLAHAAALTGVVKGILSALDTADKKIMVSITVFFV